jgi:Ca-activated chloride channel family protein
VPPGKNAPADAEVAEVAIDPNGRFATTYRPGAGHLASFESAVARGVVPESEREVVADLGARYVPVIDAPKGKALTVRTDLERGKLAPSGGTVHARISLRSTDQAAASRPHLSVHLVLDVSGSMAGEPIVRAREAAAALVDKLAPGDDFSLVTFSSDAKVLVPDGPVGARREAIKKTIAGIVEGGGTNISGGLELGYQEAGKAGIPEDAVRVVLLMSDGRANAGLLSTPLISKLALDAFQKGVQTSSFGVGTDYDGELMSAIAGDGAGGYYYLRDAAQLSPALATELDKRVDPVATAVELRVRLKPGVVLKNVYGSRRLTEEEAARVRVIEVAADQQAQQKDNIKKDRQEDNKGGMRFFMPAFARGDTHSILLKVELPPGVGASALADVELKYKDRVAKKNVIEEFPVKVAYGNSDAESAQSADASVARTVQGFAAGETLMRASRHIARNERTQAVALLSEREGILRKAAETLNEPLFVKDAERLARLRSHAGATTGLGDPLLLAMLMETAGNVHLH